MVAFQKIADSIILGNAKLARDLTEQALQDGLSPQEILENGLIAGMNVVGVRFRKNEIYVPEVLISARAMKAALENLSPMLTQTKVKPKGKVILGTVKGDLHDIGKNLVGMMLEGAGFEIVDLGIDVSPEKFASAVEQENANILGMSALLTTTMIGMKTVIDTLAVGNLRDKVQVIVGGAPVTQHYCEEIGADGYAPDSASAVDLVKALLDSK
ncbi:methionine synthase [bacterium BMS3Abin05]|nr:methionine synthase [bacterium BMS3Abin05]GBE28593.1 methionine synthase [bacterium BMS3Bbin03]HDK35478.1 cobalamin-binding protein [Bacteroidota bacterium]HDZ10607.1 cobalamin-binding protein [Bacteroidota bacterium]